MSGDEVDAMRLRNWARGYQRLMRGGLGEQAHTVCVDDFASDEGEYPYVTAADVLAMLDERDALRAQVERVRALAETPDWYVEVALGGSDYVDGRIRDALDGPQ